MQTVDGPSDIVITNSEGEETDVYRSIGVAVMMKRVACSRTFPRTPSLFSVEEAGDYFIFIDPASYETISFIVDITIIPR